MHGEGESPEEGLIEMGPEVGGEHGNAVVRLHPLEEIADLDIGVPVERIIPFGAAPEQGIGFVEEKDAVRALGGGEDPLEVLLRLADVLADHGGEIHPEEVDAEFVCQHLGGHGLACARGSGKECVHPASARQPGAESPALEYRRRAGRARAELPQLGDGVSGEDEIVPLVCGARYSWRAPRARYRIRPGRRQRDRRM